MRWGGGSSALGGAVARPRKDERPKGVEGAFGALETEQEHAGPDREIFRCQSGGNLLFGDGSRLDKVLKPPNGWVAEWFKAPVLKFD